MLWLYKPTSYSVLSMKLYTCQWLLPEWKHSQTFHDVAFIQIEAVFEPAMWYICLNLFGQQIEYPPFEKNFYDEHEEITSLTPQQVVELRHKLNLRVRFRWSFALGAVLFGQFSGNYGCDIQEAKVTILSSVLVCKKKKKILIRCHECLLSYSIIFLKKHNL